MDINLYHQCPCHPDKKIKFCCGKDVVGGLSEAMAKAQAEQPAAALDTVNRVISKEGERDCLISMKSRLLLSLSKIEESEQVNEQFLARNPGHFLGLQQRVALAVGRHDPMRAFEYLQDAIDAVTGATIPLSFAKSFEQVGALLADTGFRLAAREHFLVALRFHPENDECKQAVMALSQLQREYSVLARRFVLPPPPETETVWLKKYQNVLRAYNRGQFRKAMQILDKALDLAQTEPLLIEAKACLSTCLVDPNLIAAAFRNVAQNDSFSLYKRIEFELISQFVDPNPGPTFDQVNVTFEVEDLDSITREAMSSETLIEVDPEKIGFSEDMPRPRYCFIQLDHAPPKTSEGLELEKRPSISAMVQLFGRQTDRKPCVVWSGTQSQEFDGLIEALKKTLSLSEAASKIESIGKVRQQDHYRNLRYQLPPNTDQQTRDQLIADVTNRYYQEVWPDLIVSELGNRKPREVFGNKDFEIPLRAILMKFQIAEELGLDVESRAAALAKVMGLEPTPRKELSDRDVDFTAPVATIFYGLFENVSTRVLIQIFQACMNFGLFSPILRAGHLLLERPDLRDLGIHRANILSVLATTEIDLSKALSILAEARKEAKADGLPIGQFMVTELHMRLNQQKFAGIESLIHEISQHHLDEPEVEERLMTTLVSHGLLARDGSVMIPVEEKPEKTGLWTPDGEAEVPGQEKSRSSKLWIPGT